MSTIIDNTLNDNARTLAPAAVGSQVALMSVVSVSIVLQGSGASPHPSLIRSSPSSYSTSFVRKTRYISYPWSGSSGMSYLWLFWNPVFHHDADNYALHLFFPRLSMSQRSNITKVQNPRPVFPTRSSVGCLHSYTPKSPSCSTRLVSMLSLSCDFCASCAPFSLASPFSHAVSSSLSTSSTISRMSNPRNGTF